MKICICDDEVFAHDIIKSYMNSFFLNKLDISITHTFSGEELLENYANKNTFDVIFLDIEMLHLTGIQVAENIKKIAPETIIIFVSNYPNYVFEAFAVEALHFLVKPISKADFENVFKRAIYKYKSLNQTITLKWQNERYVIKIDSIKYIEGYKRHITVYTKDGNFEALGKIPDLLKELSVYGFIRTHQGFIVNMDYIKRFDASDVILFDDTKVMISVRKRTDALQAFDDYLKNKKW